MEEPLLMIDHVSKQYVLGQIGGTTLRDELQRWNARIRGKEDPTRIIGSKEYNKRERFWALNDVCFNVKKGERVGMIGHNGAGKSTLLKLISRVTAPTDGRIGINGRVASMLEVGTGFHPELTGRENIYMNGAILGMTKKEINKKMEEIIEFSECRQFIDTPVKRYSSGMYVKLAFSVSAHLDSEIMIMDEVLAVGDMSFQQKCLGKMSDVSKSDGRTILYVSHNMSTIRQLCDRCIVLEHGKLIYDGEVDTAISFYAHKNDEMSLKYDYRKEKRVAGFTQKVAMESLEVLDRGDSFFNSTEKIRLCLNWKALFNLRDVRFRMVISYRDTTQLGMMTTIKGIEATKEEEYQTILSLDLSMFASGVYYADLYCYSNTGNGGVENYDVIGNAFSFEVSNTSPETAGLEWHHTAWGHAVLPAIELIE